MERVPAQRRRVCQAAHYRQTVDCGFFCRRWRNTRRSSTNLGSGYEASTIAYKYYPHGDVPTRDEQLAKDLEVLLPSVYENKVVPTDQPDVDLAVVASKVPRRR